MENLIPNRQELFNRNIGFINQTEQVLIHQTPVFVAGVGGMGGACLMSLARTGAENIGIADIDSFEVSNINRQVFANLRNVGQDKAQSSLEQIKFLNPHAQVTNFGKNWLDQIDQIMSRYKIFVNGTDDLKATLLIYRKAKQFGVTVIDSYTAPLPSIYLTRPIDPRPEERLKFPTLGKEVSQLTTEELNICKLHEVIHVMAHSSSIYHIDFEIAMEMISGKRSRMSFAPMVITTGNLMAYAALALMTQKEIKGLDCRGYFFNPYTGQCEHPSRQPIAFFKELFVKLYLRKVLK